MSDFDISPSVDILPSQQEEEETADNGWNSNEASVKIKLDIQAIEHSICCRFHQIN